MIIDAGERELMRRAMSRAAEILGIGEAELKLIVDPSQDDDAIRFVMMYRDLLSVTGDERTARDWLNGFNEVFGTSPRKRMVEKGGLQEVGKYLEGVVNR